MKLLKNTPGLAWTWMVLVCTLLFRTPDAYTAVRIGLTRTGPQTLSLTWPSSPNVIYRVQSSTNAHGPWKKSFSPVLGNGQQKSIPLPSPKPMELFRLTELSIDSSIDLTEDHLLSGTVQIDITALATSGDIQSIGLWDIFRSTTNVLDYIDIRDPSRRSFTVNTAHLRNGTHGLQLELITPNLISYSDMVPVRSSNAIAVVSQIPTEFMRYLEFVPHATNGTYSVIVKNDQGTMVQSTNRNMAGSLSTNGTIVFKDGSARFTNIYSSAYFDYTITTVVGQTTSTYSFRSPTVSVFDWLEGTVIGQVPAELDIETSELERMLLAPTVNFGFWGDMFIFATQTRETTVESWNMLADSTYEVCNDYLLGSYGRAPSHVHIYSSGGTDYVGSRSTNKTEGVSTATLQSLSLSNRPTFLFLDGCSVPRSLAAHLSGITDLGARWSRADLLREGRRPHVVFYWKDTPFPYQEADVSVRHRSFIADLYTELWKPDFIGLPAQTIDVALAKMRQRYPGPMSELYRMGSTDIFIDETLPHQ
ncbi:MAG: hypothetical protein AAB381_02900 [Patescibacteria group bacterium]